MELSLDVNVWSCRKYVSWVPFLRVKNYFFWVVSLGGMEESFRWPSISFLFSRSFNFFGLLIPSETPKVNFYGSRPNSFWVLAGVHWPFSNFFLKSPQNNTGILISFSNRITVYLVHEWSTFFYYEPSFFLYLIVVTIANFL